MYIADLHIHSRYSRATSRDCTPEYLDLWARRKGIHIVGTGDFTHPAWREELKEKLEPAQDGFYVLKAEFRIKDSGILYDFVPRFVITGEISSIYKKNDRVRKVHSLILLPGLEDAQLVSQKLENIGNIHSDGRPILGLDCRDLLEITLELAPQAIYVPAHIWTPHFSLFGAFSGFDTVEECFEDLTPHIHAMETGLSSDPPMNWRISALDKYHLISNSDAHSPAKLGREANLLDIPLSYEGLYGAIQEGKGLAGTLEFFPEEGKYHFDGHRKCHLCLSPREAEKYGGKCPVCGRKLTIGVSHRVEQLSDRDEGFVRENAVPFESIVPLPEVIAACTGHGATSASVERQYAELLRTLGPEFEILRKIPIEDIEKTAGHLISEGIRRLRCGQVTRLPGFDGEYGTIKLFETEELENTAGQMSLFDCFGSGFAAEQATQHKVSATDTIAEAQPKPKAADINIAAAGSPTSEHVGIDPAQISDEAGLQAAAAQLPVTAVPTSPGLNLRQQEAVAAVDRTVAVIAGPGTGKTKTLISRILYLLETRRVRPSEMTAVTFTNKAAAEMRERLQQQPGMKRAAGRIQIGTFHALCLNFLKQQGIEFVLADTMETLEIAEDIVKAHALKMSARQFLQAVSLTKIQQTQNSNEAVADYNSQLASRHIFDFDDLLLETIKLLNTPREASEMASLTEGFKYLLVDEFQDVSPVQYALIRAWNQHGRELFVIGDPDQSIYGFRGADAGCFSWLAMDDPQTRVIQLEVNYRSTPPIVGGAMAVIAGNPAPALQGAEAMAQPPVPSPQGPEAMAPASTAQQSANVEKNGAAPARLLRPHQEGGRPIRLVHGGSEMAEAIFVAKEINRQIGGIDMLDAQEKALADGPQKQRSFADIAVLYRTHRQADLLEVCLKKEGIPYVVAGRDDYLLEKSVRGTVAFFRAVENPGDVTARAACLKLIWDLDDNDVSHTVFTAAAEKYAPMLKRTRPGKLLERWMDDVNLAGDGAMNKLMSMTIFYKTMAEFLDALTLGVESDLYRCGGKQYTADAVKLMTLHGSKGLEFPVAMIYGVRKGTIPFESETHPADLAEERRLFYVGMTRAKEELILTTSGEPSEFLGDIPESFMVREDANKLKTKDEQLSLFDFM